MTGAWLPFLHTHLLAFADMPLAAFISLDTLREALSTLGYPAVALFIMIESTGIPFPGETMLLLASFYAAVDHRLQIPLVIACAAFGAIIGDNLGYLIGRTGGYALVQRFGHYVFLKPAHLQKAQRFFARHGDKTVFFGRFIAVLRAWAAFLAGVNHMPWPTFLLYNAAGGILWSIVYGCLGFYAGRILHNNFGAVEQIAKTISWGGAAAIVVIIVVVYFLWRLRRKHQHTEQVENAEIALDTVSPETPAPLQAIELPPTEPDQQSCPEDNEQQSILPTAALPITDAQDHDETPGTRQEAPSSPEAE